MNFCYVGNPHVDRTHKFCFNKPQCFVAFVIKKVKSTNCEREDRLKTSKTNASKLCGLFTFFSPPFERDVDDIDIPRKKKVLISINWEF